MLKRNNEIIKLQRIEPCGSFCYHSIFHNHGLKHNERHNDTWKGREDGSIGTGYEGDENIQIGSPFRRTTGNVTNNARSLQRPRAIGNNRSNSSISLFDTGFRE